ncbi:hypothetical protein Ae201684P_006213 [Aphanomyces euteiches]|uniref:Uncharacterized protein n=1 Tax=Aphanomyces euteiches TaxID=100861 RepID=A0A6G0XBD2_9STRA|nr:hypothetical protein Ae201684_006630 [Aphanomyces euteiches]KAH9090808.1 hypothetical protein Ae201684P_006213 [Aphanomyces euteiches]
MYRVEHGLRLLTPMFEYIVPAQTALVPDDETWQRRPHSFAVLGARKRQDYIDSPKAIEFAVLNPSDYTAWFRFFQITLKAGHPPNGIESARVSDVT